MITIRFSELDGILTFDGSVLEFFYPNHNSQRVHIHHVRSIQVVIDRKGKRQLQIKSSLNNQIPPLPFGEPLDARVNDLVVQVQQAMTAFQSE